MIPTLLHQLEERGCKGRVVPVRHLHNLQEEIADRHRQGVFDDEFYQERLAGFKFDLPDDLPEARSLIVVAVPQPQIRFTFTWNGEATPLVVPPTYLHWRETNKQVEDLVAEIMGAQGYRVAQGRLPEKLLAAHSGLGAYGRNNICYVDGLGSFHSPVVLVSDLPCPEDTWQEARMLERCQTCQACLRACPTGAITAERFLLHAERCLTFRNEKPGSVPFPAWLDPAWHNCLVGCMICQRVCPENKEFLGWVEEGAEFSAEETSLLLEKVPPDQLPDALMEKLTHWDLVDLLDILPRNLGVLLG
ncbi:MAG: epoxyqueuosine reductase [Anaerolineae bacterium]|nr:epoxyqueuosine reductase [Anaerolineae bacterium]